MERLLGAGVLVMVAVCTGVGARLLWLSARTRKPPEFLLGSAFVLLGGVGYPLAIVARGGPGGAPSPDLLLVALGFQDRACAAMYASTWKTFHSATRWGAGVCALALVGFAASLFAGSASGGPDEGAWYYLGFALRSGAFAWAAFESHASWRRLRRKDALDLGDPAVTNRFFLWTLSTLGILAGFAIFLCGRFTSENVGADPWVLSATSVVSLASAATMWLAFVPTRRYTRWLARRSAASL